MLIGFIGCPCSGKTTTAAMSFADLKNMGISSEFIPEQARAYIARARYDHPDDPIELDDIDQLAIMEIQTGIEKIMTYSKGTVVITDTSILNTLLYMSPKARQWHQVKHMVEQALARYDILFYCAPVRMTRGYDANRIHDEQQSLELDKQIPEILREFAPELKPVVLLGDTKERHYEVTKGILEVLSR